MTAFAHVEYPTEHPGVVRAENAAAALKSAAAHFDGARGAASLLLAAVVFPDWLGRLAGLAFALANGGLAWVLFRAVGRYRQAWLDMTLKLAIKKK